MLFGCLPRGKWRIRPSASAPKQSAHSGPVTSVAFSPDGKTIVSGSSDKTLKVWDAGTPARLIPHLAQNLSAPTLAAASLELKAEKQSAHSREVMSVAFSPDGKTIVSGSVDKTLKVWDAGTSTAGTHPPDSPLDTPTPTPMQRA